MTNRLFVFLLAGFTAACSTPAATPIEAESAEPTIPKPRLRYSLSHEELAMPRQSKVAPGPRPRDTAAPKLTYRGGEIVVNPKVVAVFWGPNVPSATQTGVVQFFQQAIATPQGGPTTPYIKMLSEYNVPAYTIGDVSYAGSYVDTTAPIPSSLTISDAQVQHELARLIDAKLIPTNDGNTMYMVYFDPTVFVAGAGGLSCQLFCGYHESFQHNGVLAYYSILPDHGSNGCQLGCTATSGGNALAGLYSTTAHELVETITDPHNGLGWYDTFGGQGEIGDICTEWDGTSGNFNVQTEWSNESNGCRDRRPAATGVSATVSFTPDTPGTAGAPSVDTTVAPGGMATFMITVAGNATPPLTFETPLLQFTQRLTATFNPPMLTTSTGTTTMTLPIPMRHYSGGVGFKIGVRDGDGVHHFASPLVGVLAGPVKLTSVSPNGAPSAGGGQVTFIGNNIPYDAQGFLCTPSSPGAKTCDLNQALFFQLQFAGGNLTVQLAQGTTPGFPAGAALIGVLNPSDPNNPSFLPFTITPPQFPPKITKMTPDHGPVSGNTVVQLKGSGFGPQPTVLLGGKPQSTVSAIDANTVIFVTDKVSAAAAVDVVLDNGDGVTAKAPTQFTYGAAAQPPLITHLDTRYGPTTGGTYVSVDGFGFQAQPTIKFGSTPATVVSFNAGFYSTSIGVTTPANSAGTVDVTITNADNQTFTLPMAFTYTDKPAPTITSLMPSSGYATGGDSVVITGTGFDTNATVQIAGAPVMAAAGQTATSITVTTPPGTAPVDPRIPFFAGVTVINADGQLATAPFTYLPPPPPDMAMPPKPDLAGYTGPPAPGGGSEGCSIASGAASAAPTTVAPLWLLVGAVMLLRRRRRA